MLFRSDVYLVHGWLDQPDLVHQRIAQARMLTCAAPSYWAEHGVPQHPRDLAEHQCLLYVNDEGTVADLWKYERDGEVESVAASGWLISNSREINVHAALAGAGVIRASDLMSGEHLVGGRLTPVLLDWTMQDAPPINLLFHANQRRNPRVRLFIDFITSAFRELESQFEFVAGRRSFIDRPYWLRRNRRASEVLPVRS